jgi:polysaccharide chain length determinant protein (PEP-CTERM system associated)
MHEFIANKLAPLRGAWDHRWLAVATAWCVFAVGVLAVSRYPERYEATAKVFVNTQSMLKPLIEGLTVQPNIDQQLAMLAKTLISRPTVEQLIADPALGLAVPQGMDRDAYVDSLIKQIKVSTSGRENLYIVSFRDQDPSRAQRLVQSLVSLFMQSGASDKRADTDDARSFINTQIKTYEAKLTEAENKVRDFKTRNIDVASTPNNDFFQRINSTQEELDKLMLELRANEQARDALRRQIQEQENNLNSAADAALTSSNFAVPEIDARISDQKKQLDELLRRFTEDHPDVVAARRVIGQLEKQKHDELVVRSREAKTGNRSSLASDPVLQKIRVSLAEAEASVASLRARVSDRQARVAQLRSAAGRVPQVEAELAQLNRDYDVVRKNYDALVARRESASIAVAVDATSQLAEFRVVEPPHVGQSPVFPSKKMLVIVVLLVAVGGAAGTAFLVAQSRPVIYDMRSLRALTQRPVLGAVTFIADKESLSAGNTDTVKFYAAAGALLVAHLAWLGWLSLRAGA